MIELSDVRRDFPALQQWIHGHPMVYFDWAATTQVPQCVIDTVTEQLALRGNVRRGVHSIGHRSTEVLNASRLRLAEWIGGDASELILTSGATSGLNMLVQSVGELLAPDDVVVLTALEHHSHLLPWQRLAERCGIRLVFVSVDDAGRISLAHLTEILSTHRVRVIGCTLVSNVLGTRQPIEDITVLAKANGVRVVVDASQAAAHMPISVKKMGVDALVVGGHKVYGPAGTGLLWVKSDWLQTLQPSVLGGGAVHEVTLMHHRLTNAPARFEAGTPNVSGFAGLTAAVDWLDAIGWDVIQTAEERLRDYLIARLSNIPEVRLLCAAPDIPILAFEVDGIHAHDVGTMLDLSGIIVRSGQHCAQPLHQHWGVEASTRISLSFVNTLEECDVFLSSLRSVISEFGGFA